MKVVGYVRVSTDEQDRSGLGIAAQIQKIEAYCSLYDLELVEMVKDSWSGKTLNRPGLQHALDLMRRGEAGGLVTAKLDRLTRSVKDLGTLLEDYFNRYALFVVAEQVDTRTAAGRLVMNVLASVAQWERETIGERTRDALRAKRRRGEHTGGKEPFGFDVLPDGTLAKNPQEQGIIFQIDALRRKGYSYRAIAGALHDEGFTTKHGQSINHVQIARVLNRTAIA